MSVVFTYSPTKIINKFYSYTNTISLLCLVNIKQETFEYDVGSQAAVEVTPAIESPGKHGVFPLAFVPATPTTFASTQSKDGGSGS